MFLLFSIGTGGGHEDKANLEIQLDFLKMSLVKHYR